MPDPSDEHDQQAHDQHGHGQHGHRQQRGESPRRFRWQRWAPWVALVIGAVAVGRVWLGDPAPPEAVLLTAVVTAAVVGVFWTARRGRHTPYDRAEQLLADGQVVVLWKPGCTFCERLLVQLRGTPGITWVNVYEDPQADAKVRSVNGGDQLTPTALVGDRVLRNPSAAQLRELLSAA